LFGVPRTQHQLLPFYARFTAILSQYYPEIGVELLKMLLTEFWEMQEQNDIVKIETKIRNIRFIGELTKFGVCEPQVALECLKKCMDDFIGHNLELISNLLEACGPFLMRSKDSSVSLKINNMLDITWRLKEKESSIPSK